MNNLPSRLAKLNTSMESAYLLQKFIATDRFNHMYVKDRQSRLNARLLAEMIPNPKRFEIDTGKSEFDTVPCELACDLPISAFNRNDIAGLRLMKCVDKTPISRGDQLLVTVKTFIKIGKYLFVERLSTQYN